MNYSSIRTADIANGIGWRVTLWVTGCARKCPGCFNEVAQDPSYGKKFDEEAKEKIFRELEKDTCDGLSLMGGEPMSRFSDNRKQIIQLCREVKERFPGKTTWVWSGYTYEELVADPETKDLLNYIDVLVDGPFIQERKDLSCPYRGSTNQRVIMVQETNRLGKIAEMNFTI